MEPTAVILTDGDTDTLANMRINVLGNCHESPTIMCKQLIWGSGVEGFIERNGGDFDTIIGSDVVYTVEALAPLFRTVAELLPVEKDRGQFLLAYTRRNVAIELVLEEATRSDFVWERPVEVKGVFVFTRKNSAEVA